MTTGFQQQDPSVNFCFLKSAREPHHVGQKLKAKPEPKTGITPGHVPPPNYSTAAGTRDWPIDASLVKFSPAADGAAK